MLLLTSEHQFQKDAFETIYWVDCGKILELKRLFFFEILILSPMIINFRIVEINQVTSKLIQIFILIIKKKEKKERKTRLMLLSPMSRAMPKKWLV